MLATAHRRRHDYCLIEHQRWAHWQRYVHDNGKRQTDGSIILLAARRHVEIPYFCLNMGRHTVPIKLRVAIDDVGG
jgi:hypothetical protein